MERRNKYLRFSDMHNGDLALCKIDDKSNWNKIGFVIAVYHDGLFYDALCKEDDLMPREDYDITDIVEEYSIIGKNVKNIYADVL